MAKLNLEKITAAGYAALTEVKNDTIYWLDNGTIYTHGKLYGGKVEFVTADPTTPELNVLYVNSTTKKIKSYNGTALTVISNGYTEDMSAALAEGGDDTLAPTAAAIKDYLEEFYTTDLVVTAGKYTQYTDDEGVEHSEIWLSIAEKGAADPYANPDDVIKIPVGDLIDIYTGDDTSSVSIDVTDNVITATVQLHEADDNILTIEDDGLYVAAADLSDYATKVGADHEDEVALYDEEGNLKAAGYSIGGEELAETVDETTLATEKAVKAYADSLITWTNF